jgi:hypothetical protein
MPYKMIRLKCQSKKKGCKSKRYKVINVKTGKVHSKKTTLKKGKAQMRLLESLDK